MVFRQELTDTWPYRPAEAINARLDRHSDRSNPDVCWPWRGFGRTQGGCCLGFIFPDGKRVAIQVKHLTWWLKHGERIMRPIGLRPTCKTQHCINPDHFTRINCYKERRWTDKEVEALRKEYWGTPARPGRRCQGNRAEDPVFRAAKQLSLDKGTVQRVLDGKRIFPAKWARPPLTAEEILEEVERAKIYVAKAQERYDNRLSQHGILNLHHECAHAPLTSMLTGKTYKRAGGPTGRVMQSASALDEIDDDDSD